MKGALALLAALLVAAAVRAEPVVIVLSWDGVRHDLPDRYPTPALRRMARAGARASQLVPVFPSNTFPGHISLATGTYPDRHGIVDNRFFDRERGLFDYDADASWIDAEPLWAAAERQGVPSAVFFWVGSETDWRGVGARHRRAPFDPGVDEAAKVEQILRWLDLPEPERPRLVMSWWHGVDHVAHRKGPDHPDVADALAAQDTQLARLLAGLDARDAWAETTLLVVSDHGMTEVSEAVALEEPLQAAGVDARVQTGSSVAHVFVADAAARPAALRALEAVPGITVYPREALPAALRLAHPTRTGDLVVLTEPPRALRVPTALQQVAAGVGGWLGWRAGLHGYAPGHPDMPGILLALGRGVPAGAELGDVHMIDVAPTVTALLGIEPPAASEGRPIPELDVDAPAGAATR